MNRVIELARAELGYCEKPVNLTKYGEAYGGHMNGQPWCVMFLWWVFREAGERKAFMGGGQTASCSILLRWYKEQGLTVPVEDVQEGDIVLLNFRGERTPDHCGLVVGKGVEHYYRFVKTIEGNTSPSDGSQSNGGMVCEKVRYPRNIVAVCRPQYQPEEAGDDLSTIGCADGPPPLSGEAKVDVSGHWAEDSIRWCVAHGLIKGYPDGSFQPDKAVTRAELAAVLRRLALVEE